ncbi:MAG: PadR family transcriptional regulator [Acidobacteria bacterium]|nr:PadR family transcriptional regulator [Acidobacteriota bacterium]
MSKSAPLTPLGVAALGLLLERSMHPYEMYLLLMQRSEDRLLKVRPGTLYHAVARLADASLVAAGGTDRDGNRPERTYYEITPAGRAALTSTLEKMLSVPVNEYPTFPLAVAESHNLPKESVISLLGARLELLAASAAELEAGAQHASGHAPAQKYWIDVRFQQAMLAAEVDWITHFIHDLETGALPW